MYDVASPDIIDKNYDDVKFKRMYKIVNFSTSRYQGKWNPQKYTPIDDKFFINPKNMYAYGYIINPSRTNILIVDIDEDDPTVMQLIRNTLMDQPWVSVIDIAGSSFDELTMAPISYHLYVGLDAYYNTVDFYKLLIPGACEDFLKCVTAKQELVIRASRKFNSKTKIDTNIRWLLGFSRKDKDTWVSYTSEQLIAPLTTVDGVSLSETPHPKAPSLKLRG